MSIPFCLCVTAFAMTWFIYDYAVAENARLSRKNPDDYVNDQ